MKRITFLAVIFSFATGQAVLAGSDDSMSSTPKTGSMSTKTSTHQCGEGR